MYRRVSTKALRFVQWWRHVVPALWCVVCKRCVTTHCLLFCSWSALKMEVLRCLKHWYTSVVQEHVVIICTSPLSKFAVLYSSPLFSAALTWNNYFWSQVSQIWCLKLLDTELEAISEPCVVWDTMVSIEVAFFWEVMSYTSVDDHRCFEEQTAAILWIVYISFTLKREAAGCHIPNYVVSHPRSL